MTYDVKTQETIEIVGDDSAQPVISPDLRKVMYLKIVPNGSELWISEGDGKNAIRIATGKYLSAGEWSPDNLRVHFIDYTSGDDGKLFVADANGRNITPIWAFKGWYSWSIFSADGKSIYVTTRIADNYTLWKVNVDGSKAEKFLDPGFTVTDTTLDGKVLLGINEKENNKIYQASVDDRKMTLISDASTSFVKRSTDGKSILYLVPGLGETILYRHKWNQGKLIGKPEITLRLPFSLNVRYGGAGCDFARDLSTIVYSKPTGQDDLYVLSR